MADVAAKDSAQETAVNLIASMVALLILTYIGNSQIIFCIMIILHIVFNYLAVRSVCLKTFNEPRFLHTINRYLKHEIISTPCEINRDEPIIMIGKCVLDLRLCGFNIKLGHSLRNVMEHDLSYNNIQHLKLLYSDRKYILYPDTGVRWMYVILMEDATAEDILKAYFHAVFLSMLICSINRYPLAVYESTPKDTPFAQVCQTIQDSDWFKEDMKGTNQATNTYRGDFHSKPSQSLMKYVSENVDKEWTQMRIGLRKTGWNLEKHLLVADEWRVHNGKNKKNN